MAKKKYERVKLDKMFADTDHLRHIPEGVFVIDNERIPVQNSKPEDESTDLAISFTQCFYRASKLTLADIGYTSGMVKMFDNRFGNDLLLIGIQEALGNRLTIEEGDPSLFPNITIAPHDYSAVATIPAVTPTKNGLATPEMLATYEKFKNVKPEELTSFTKHYLPDVCWAENSASTNNKVIEIVLPKETNHAISFRITVFSAIGKPDIGIRSHSIWVALPTDPGALTGDNDPVRVLVEGLEKNALSCSVKGSSSSVGGAECKLYVRYQDSKPLNHAKVHIGHFVGTYASLQQLKTAADSIQIRFMDSIPNSQPSGGNAVSINTRFVYDSRNLILTDELTVQDSNKVASAKSVYSLKQLYDQFRREYEGFVPTVLETGGYRGTADDLKNHINSTAGRLKSEMTRADELQLTRGDGLTETTAVELKQNLQQNIRQIQSRMETTKLPKGDYSGTASTLKQELERSISEANETWSQQYRALSDQKLDRDKYQGTASSLRQEYLRKFESHQSLIDAKEDKITRSDTYSTSYASSARVATEKAVCDAYNALYQRQTRLEASMSDSYLKLAGGTMNGSITMNGNSLRNVSSIEMNHYPSNKYHGIGWPNSNFYSNGQRTWITAKDNRAYVNNVQLLYGTEDGGRQVLTSPLSDNHLNSACIGVGNGNEISFGCTGPTIWFGYRRLGNQAVSQYFFGSSDASGKQTGTIYCGGVTATSAWFNSDGPRGWYNTTYGGGIYQTDPTWVQIYGSKSLLVNGTFRSNRTENAIFNDYAELFQKPFQYQTEPGDIIGLLEDSDIELFGLATYRSTCVVGVHSDEYGMLIGGNKEMVPDHPEYTLEQMNADTHIPVGLVGRVSVKFIGKAKKGMRVIPSKIPGVGEAYVWWKHWFRRHQIIGIVVVNDARTEQRKVRISLIK